MYISSRRYPVVVLCRVENHKMLAIGHLPYDIKYSVFFSLVSNNDGIYRPDELLDLCKSLGFPTRRLPRKQFDQDKLRMFDYMYRTIPTKETKILPYNRPSYVQVTLPIPCKRCRNSNNYCDDTQYCITTKGEIYHVITCQEAMELSVSDDTQDNIAVVIYQADEIGTTYVKSVYEAHVV